VQVRIDEQVGEPTPSLLALEIAPVVQLETVERALEVGRLAASVALSELLPEV
jgi:hypothetical protein